MRSFLGRGSRALAVVALVGAGLAVTPGVASATIAPAVCTGGSVASGTYSSLVIAGLCAIDSGNVTVHGPVTLQPGSALNAAFGGSDLSVSGSVLVLKDAILVLGCEPENFVCFNDPDQNVGTLSTHDTIGGSLVGSAALMILAHHNTINGSVAQAGGGGGVTCDTLPLGPDGPPAYSTYEDNTIGGNASVSGLGTCWLGFIRNHVAHNVNFSSNVTADPDGNEVVSNTVSANLVCVGNSPAAQFGDSSGNANIVSGMALGQCKALT